MTKTYDKSNKAKVETYNFSGWGNKKNILDLKDAEAIELLRQRGKTYKEIGRIYGVAASTAWRVHKLWERVNDKVIGVVGDYDTNFRMAACRHAIYTRSATETANTFGCTSASVLNWLKAYDMTHLYFIR